jgi:hypothetical protein
LHGWRTGAEEGENGDRRLGVCAPELRVGTETREARTLQIGRFRGGVQNGAHEGKVACVYLIGMFWKRRWGVSQGAVI